MWEEKKALIKAITKYNWFVANPNRLHHPIFDLDLCHLCLVSKELLCKDCLMFGRWPDVKEGLTEACTDPYSVWNIWNCNSKYPRLWSEVTTYDRAFFALVLVDAFHKRLQELYR